jgi:sulfofructose kinase
MADLDVVGLGMAVLDVLIRLKDMPTWEHGSSISAFRLDGGGPVGTAMAAAARLGARAAYIGTAGNDVAADIKLRELERYGVDLRWVVRRPVPESQVVLVYVDERTGERVFSGLQRLGESLLRPEELDRQAITSAEYLHLDGFHAEAALQAARWMKEAGKKVVLDAAKHSGPLVDRVFGHMKELIGCVDILISGSGFAPALTGKDDIWEAGEAVLEFGPSIVVQTEGADGSYTVTRDERFHMPAFPVEVVDTTGAGDVFHGAYIVGLLQGWDLRQITAFSTAVSAIKCTKLGGRAGVPCFEDAVAFARRQGIAIP